MKKSFLLFMLFFYLQTVGGILADDKRRVLLRWNEVPQAEKYIIEIRDKDKKTIIREEVNGTSITVEIESGNYERRISVYNKLGEVEVATNWSSFNVLLVKAPELDSSEPISVTPKSSKIIPLQGKNFDKDMKVSLVSGDTEIPAKQTMVENENRATAEFAEEVPPGNYDLVLANPKKSSTYSGKVVSQKEKIKPKSDHGLRKWEIVKRSAVLPGWGEYYAGQKVPEPKYEKRGKIYFGAFAFSTFLYLYFNEFTFPPNKKTPTVKKYETDSTNYLVGSFVLPNLSNNSRRVAALYGLQVSRELEEKVNTQAQRTNIMLGLMAGIYIIQLVDAFFIEKDLELVQSPLFRNFQFSMTPQKISTGQIETYYHLGYGFSF